jgi:Family of unknown function (DUF5343)
MPLEPNGPAPYAPPSAIIETIKAYRDKGLRTPFTVEVLARAGVPESLGPRTLQAFKLLELVDSEGNPHPQFEQAVRAPEAEFKDSLRDLLLNAYSDVFAFADPGTESLERLRDAFRTYTPVGQQERMVTLFLGLLEWLGLDVSAAKATPKERPARQRSSEPRQKKKKQPSISSLLWGVNLPAAVEVGRQPRQGLPPALMSLLQDGLPKNGTQWTKGKRDSFVKTFEAILDFFFPTSAVGELPPFGLSKWAPAEAEDSEDLGVTDPAP